jgi:hypothetical protein
VSHIVAPQVKTQRALNDYRKSAFPHYKDEITRLRFIGVVSANRLKDARAHLGQDVPVMCVDTVQDLKKLVEYAETNRCGWERAGVGFLAGAWQHLRGCGWSVTQWQGLQSLQLLLAGLGRSAWLLLRGE